MTSELASVANRAAGALIQNPEFRFGGEVPLAGTMDEANSQGDTVPLRQDGFQIVPPLLLIPSYGGQRAYLGEKRSENLARRCMITVGK